MNNIFNKSIDANISSALSEILKTEGINVNGKWAPSVNIFENEKELIVHMGIPLLDESSLNIEFINNQILVTGKNNNNMSGYVLKRNEFNYGNFERKIVLPIHIIDKTNVSVEFIKGILVINIQKNKSENHFSINLK